MSEPLEPEVEVPPVADESLPAPEPENGEAEAESENGEAEEEL